MGFGRLFVQGVIVGRVIIVAVVIASAVVRVVVHVTRVP